MPDSSLQDRLRESSKAFDSLLSLIPAKMYYGEDTSDQWNRKKQTKAEAKAARMNKLDPDSDLNRSAKEIMDERAKNKRKLRELEEAERAEEEAAAPPKPAGDDEAATNSADDAPEGITREEPGEGLRRRDEQPHKKRKHDRPDEPLDNLASVADANPAEMTQEQLMKAAKHDAQKADRKAKKEKKAEKRAAKQAAKEAAAAEKATKDKSTTDKATEDKSTSEKPKQQKKQAVEPVKKSAKSKAPQPTSKDDEQDDGYETVSSEGAEDGAEDDAAAPVPEPAATKEAADSSISTPRSASQSPVFDTLEAPAATATEAASTTTSVSSAPSDKPKQLKIPTDTSALKARLAARIAELQAARKAIGPDGKPIRTRQELIEAQRARQAQRKAKKTEQRRQAKLDEERARDEALASNSPSIMSPALDHLLADDDEGGGPTDYSFGRVAFNDDTRLSRDLTYALSAHKKRGPSDPKTALLKLQNQKRRHAALAAEKQADVEEKEAWLTARRRAEGEKIRDDEGTLKKAVKRKEKQKKRSEKEWKERSEGVQRAVHEKQKKREDNLKKRKDEKKLGKAGKKIKVKVGGGKKKGASGGGRPGFEGGFAMGGKKGKK